MFKLSRQQKDHRYFCGNRYEKYSIKKLKVGAASVLIGAGFLFGYNVDTVEADSATETVVTKDADTGLNQAQGNTQAGTVSEPKAELAEKPKSNAGLEKSAEPAKPVKENEKDTEQASAVSAHTNTAEATEAKPSVDLSLLQEKLADLEAQIERIRGNKKQASQIQNAEKLVAEAKQYLSALGATQSGADKKVKEISSLTSILKSIKAEEIAKENKNQDSRNGKKLEEGTGFRTGVTDQALTGSIHFDTSKGPTEKRIPVANNGDGERVINMAITYSASSNDTVTDGKVRVTIPKAFLHSKKMPVFTNSTFVKSVDNRSTDTDYIYDLNLHPMSGGTVAESLLKLYVGTSRTNAPSKDDSLTVKTEFMSGVNVLSEKTATATFDYLSEIIYREKDTREKLVKNYLPQEQREYKIGSVVNGKLVPVSSPFRIPLIMTNDRFFNNGEADDHNQNGNGRLISYDYTISGIPEFLELDPTSPKNSKWTLENGVATLHPDQTRGIDQMLYYAGPVLRLKEGALSTPEEIAKVIETNGTKGYSAKIVYKAVGHRPDGSSFIQTLENPDGFRIYAGDGAPSIGMMEDRINAATNQRLFSNASNVDTFGAVYRVPLNNLKTDGGTLPSQYLSYLIPKDQEGNYFTKFKITQIFTNESENGSSWVRGYHSGYKDVRSQFKENFQLYGVNENNQAELIKDYTTIDELFNETTINSDKRYNHLILKTPGIVDEVQDKGQAGKTILGLTSDLDVTVDTWKEKAKDTSIQRYENKISQVLAASNTIESAIATERPNTGSSTPAVHTKEPTTLSLGMQQIGDQELTKDNLTRGKNIPIAVQYTATDYFKIAESEKNGIKVYDLDKLDSNINKTSVMLLADPKVPLKDFRLTADNRLLSKYTLYFGGANGSAAKGAYNQIKESYDTVNPTRIIENYKGTGKRAYIFESKDLGLSSYDLNRDGWIKGGTYNPVALTFEVENNGQIESGTYNIESYLVWNSNSETLFGNDRSLNANYVEGHEPGATIAKSNINVTINNVIEYSTSLTISKPGSTGTRGIIDVKNGQEVILSPRVENLTDTPQKIKEAVVLIPKSEAVTYLEGPVVDNSDEYDVVYTTSTATDKTTGTYVPADQITNWKDVTAVKYVFKKDYTVTKEHAFNHNFSLRVAADNPNFVQSTSQIFLKNGQNVWLESNTVGLRTEDVRGKLEVRYINARKDDILPKITEKEFAGQPYKTTKEDIIKSNNIPYLFKEIQADSVPETGTYERQVTKKVTYVYEEATFKEESKTITRTINYLEKNNESNVVANPVVQNITVKRKIYTGKETGRVVKGPWEYRTDAYQPNWPRTNSPRVANFEAPDREVIDRVLVSQELVNNGNVVENVYYERIMPVGGDVVAKYVIENTTTELKPTTDVAKGLKVGKSYTSTAPAAGEELTATDGKVYVYKGHKATSAAETGTVTADKQEVVYEYAPKVGGNVIAKYVIKGTTTELKESTNVSTGAQVGSEYTATAPQAGEVLKQGELEYVLEGRKADSAAEAGKVTADTQEIIYEYVPKQGGNVIAKYVIKGTTTELKASTNVSTGAQVGSEYTATAPQAGEVLKQGELEYVLEGRKADSAAEAGKVTADTQEIIYEYVPKQGGNVIAKYVIKGTTTELKASTNVSTGAQVGSEYTATAPQAGEVLKQGELEYVLEGRKADSAAETGKVTADTQEIIYEYVPKQGGNVIAKYVIKGTTTELKASTNVSTGAQVGSEYTATAPQAGEVLKQGELEYVLEGRKADSAAEAGKVTADTQEIIYEYVPKQGGNVIAKYVIKGTTTELKASTNVSTGAQVGSEYTATAPQAGEVLKQGELEYVLEGRKADSAAEAGKVTADTQEIIYEYVPRQGGNVIAKYVIKGTTTELKASTNVSTGAQVGSEYTATAPQAGEVLKQGELEYVLEGRKADSAAETGKVTADTQEIIYEYVPKQGGNVIAKYVIKGTTTELKASTNVSTGAQVGSEYTATAPQAGEVLKQGELEYVLEGRKADSAAEAGKVTADTQEIIYEYVPRQGGNVIAKYVIKGTTTELKASTNVSTGAQVGSEYTATAPQAGEVLKQGELEYVLEGRKADSAAEAGKVTADTQEIIYEYVPKQGGNVIAKYVIKGTTTELKASTNVSTGAQVGSEYTATAPQAGEVLKQGELEYVLEGRKADSAAETGKVTADTQEIIYEYVPKQGGNVIAKYVIKGTTTELKASTNVSTGAQVGSEYTATAPQAGEVLKQGELEYVLEGRKADSAAETGKVTADTQEIIYEYVPKQGGNVEVKYVIAGTETNLKDPVTLVTNGQVGSDYTATKDATITKEDGRVYKLVEANNGLKTDSATETGKVTTEKQTVTYEYELQKGDVTVSYTDTEGNAIEGKTSVKAETQSPTGKEYNTNTPELKPETITTESGKVYKLVPAQTVGKENGKVTVAPTEVTYKYELQKGDVTVSYTDTEGNAIEGKTSVKAETQSPTGKEYNTNTPELKPETITTESGKVYKLVPAQTVGKETGKVTVAPTEVTYKYELQKGDVTVNYTDTEGNAIEGKTSVKAETQSPTGKEYNTNTPELKPETITTESGKVYKLVLAQTVGKETGKVTVAPTEVTYKYELQKGDVTVNYTDTEGNAIEGKTSVKAETQSPTGKEYNTNTPELKPETITTESGKVYKLVPAQTVGKETGKVTVAPTEVTYKYELQKGDVTVNYTDTEGNAIEGKTSVKAETQSPTGKEYNTNTPELKPETITTESGKVYKLVLAQTVGKETGKVTVAPTEVTYKYELQKGDVTVSYTDTEGNAIEGKTSVKAETQSPTGKEYNTNTPELKPETITTESGKVYKLVLAQTVGKETGKVTVAPTEVTYKYELQKGDVTVSYTDTEGNAIEGKTSVKAETQSPTGKEYNTNTPELKPETITTESGKVYKLVLAQTVGKETGKVTVAPTEVTYKYELQKGDVTVNYTDTEGNAIEGKTSVKAETQSPTGKEYNTNTPDLKPETITTESGKVYKLVPAQTVGKETGKVTVAPTEVTYKYELQKGDVTVSYTDTEGNAIEGKTSVKAETQSPTGKEYNTNTPELKPETITTESGKVYKLVPAQTVGKENGKVTVAPTEVTYKYELQKGDVTVSYTDTEGNAIEGKTSVKAETQSPTGKEYNTNTPELKPETITTESGKVYKLVPAQTVGKETGKVTVAPTEVTYKYELQKGDVTVNYTDTEGNAIEGKTSVKAETQSPTGKEYNTNTPELKPETITTESGKVYKLVLAQTVGKETGKVTVAPTEVTYKYELQKGDVTVNYTDTEGNAIEGKTSVKAETQSPTGKEYNTNTPELKPETITTESGKVYKLVPAQTVGKETGKVTVAPTEVTYKYELQKGDVTVNYTDTEGNAIEGKTSVKAETQSPTGKEYNTNTPELKPETITTESGKVYKLVLAQTVGKETGKVTVAPTEVTYKYELQKGDVTVSYTDTEGNAIEGKTSVKAETQSPTGKEYNTNTPELKPETITTESGKVYKLVLAQTVGKETGKVTVAPTEVTYKYELQKGDVTVSYTDTEGNAIEGKTSVKAETQSPTGKEYNTNTPELKPETITTESGKVYKLVLAQTVGKETGKVTVAPTEVTYKYELQKGDVTVNYTDTEGNAIEGKTSVKAETQSPTGKEYNTNTPDLKPETITTESGKVYKLVPAQTVGKETGKVTVAPTEVTYKYELQKGDVTVSYTDTEGNAIEGKTSVKAETQSPTGKEYNTNTPDLKPETITTANGDVYEFVKKSETSASETGKVNTGVTTVEYVYRKVVTSYVDEEGKEISPSDKGTKDKKDIPEYIYKETKKDEKGNTTHVYRQVVTSYVNEAGKEISPSDKGTKDKKDIPEYIYKETKKDEKGNTTHVYRQVVTSYVDEEGKEISPSDKGTKDKKDIPEYIYKETKKDEKGNTTHVYRQVVTSYVDEAGKEINPSDKGTKDKKDIPEYIYKETKKDEKGNTTHVYRQVVTSYVNEAGKEISPSDKGTKDKKDIPEYIYKETKKDEKGNTTHVYRQVVTSYVNEAGKEISPSDKGTKDKKDIPEYIYKETKKDEKGNTTHVYRQVVTSYVNEEGKEISPSDKGTKDKKDIPEYIFKETKKDKDGNTIHVYTKKSSSTPYSPTPSTPSNEESKSTVWKDTEGNILKPQEDGTKDKGTFTGYEYVKTILVGNVTTHIFKKVITPIHDETPSHSDVPGQSDIPEHSDVTATSDKSTQIANSNESTFVDGKRELPNTGTQSSTSSLLLGALAAMTGLGLVSRRRKDDKE